MARLGYDEIGCIEEALRDRLLEILSRLNREDRLEAFLEYCGASDLLGNESDYEVYRNGKILVIGESMPKKEEILNTAKKLGIDKDRLELHLEYEDAKKYDFRHIRYNLHYSVIILGPMPHSGTSKGNYSSVIEMLKKEDGYPPVKTLGTDELKITKSNFRDALEMLQNEGIIS